MNKARARVQEALDAFRQPSQDDLRIAGGVCAARMEKYSEWFPWGLEPANVPCSEHRARSGELCWGPKAAPLEKVLPWTVRVEKFGSGHRTVFSVGNQHFDLARDEDGDELGHCWLIGEMFEKAMKNAGAPLPQPCFPWEERGETCLKTK